MARSVISQLQKSSVRRWRGLLCMVLLGSSWAFPADLRFSTVKREIVEARLKLVTRGNDKRSESLRHLFEESGCGGERLQIQKVQRSKLGNIVCTLPGRLDSVIVVGAHFDHAELGEGAVDNWSGAALLPSLLQAVSTQPRNHTYVFIGFTDEEKGLVGSEFYVTPLTHDHKSKIRELENLDSLGLAPTAIWLNRADSRLALALKTVADSLKLPLLATNVDQVGSTDSVSFSQRKIPSITVHSVTQKTWPILHSPNDNLSAINPDAYFSTYRVVAAYLVYLDGVFD